ncbi:YncE family protein [Thermogemmatispora sp.]|uniref:YncE family protein n=1 Tax=Thermogemmatispora sp. TaxID=1968838 RepID=UPI0035E3F903
MRISVGGRGSAFLMSLRLSLLIAVSLTLLAGWSSSQVARADGGAPNLAYVAGGGNGIGVIDIVKQQVQTSIRLAGDPQMTYLSLDGRFLYVTQPGLGSVSMIAARTGQVLCSAHVSGAPTFVAFDPGANLLYAAGPEAPLISVLDPTNCALLRTIRAASNVAGLAVAVVGSGISGGKGNQLWVSESQALAVYNSSGQRLATVPVPQGPLSITIPLGSIAYVSTRQHSIIAVNLGTRQIYPTLFRGGDFGAMDYDAITGDIYVPDKASHQLYVLAPIVPGSPPPPEPDHHFTFSASPQAVAITSDGQFGFVALANGDVAMLDIPARQIIKIFHVGGSPHFVITGLYPPALGTTPSSTQSSNQFITAALYVLIGLVILGPALFFWLRLRLERNQKAKGETQHGK